MVPTLNSDQDPSNAKASKAVVLQKAIDYIQHVETQKKRQESELNSLKKEMAALEIMRENYDQLVKAHQSSTAISGGEHGEEGIFIPTEVKFRVFQMLMDSLFMSFNEKVIACYICAVIFCMKDYIFCAMKFTIYIQCLTSSQPILLKKNSFSKGFTWPKLFQPLWYLRN